MGPVECRGGATSQTTGASLRGKLCTGLFGGRKRARPKNPCRDCSSLYTSQERLGLGKRVSGVNIAKVHWGKEQCQGGALLLHCKRCDIWETSSQHQTPCGICGTGEKAFVWDAGDCRVERVTLVSNLFLVSRLEALSSAPSIVLHRNKMLFQ